MNLKFFQRINLKNKALKVMSSTFKSLFIIMVFNFLIISTAYTSSNKGPGNALDFDGLDDSVNIGVGIGNQIANGTAITIEYWFKGSELLSPVRVQDGTLYIVAGYDFPNPKHILSNDGGTTGGVSCGDPAIIHDGNWHHIAMTWQINTINGFKSYMDGVLVASKNSANANLPNFSNIDSYLGSHLGTNLFLIGQLDEVRVWDYARSVSQIRETMCQKLSGSESGLVAYYRFDHMAGTTLSDLSGNLYHGTLINMDDSDWVLSGAAIGDSSVYDYSGTVAGDFNVNLTSSDGDTLTATGDGGLYTGIHIYLINESPNNTTPPSGCSSIDTNHYWGIFPVGTNPTYNITYNYSGNLFVNNENTLKLAYRQDNSVNTWSTSNAVLDTSLNTLSQNSYTRAEYVLGDTSIPTENVVLMMHMDDDDLADSSYYSHTVTCYGAISSDTQFKFEKSAYFDGNDYIQVSYDESLNFQEENFTIDFWLYPLSSYIHFTIGLGYMWDNPPCSDNQLDWGIAAHESGSENFGLIYCNPERTNQLITVPISINQWQHMAYVRNGTSLLYYIDGVLVGEKTLPPDFSFPDHGFDLYIGYLRGNNCTTDYYYTGYLDELRISKGVAVWTENFTVPSTPYSSSQSPVISSIADQLLVENTTSSPISFTVTDINEQVLTITYISSDETLISSTGITFSGDQVASSGSTYTVAATSVETTVTPTITPETNQSGTVFITITVTDPDGMTASSSFKITITQYDEYTVLMLHAEDNFIDSSSYSHIVNNYGVLFSDGQDGFGRAFYLNGSSYINSSDSNDWDFGIDPFTIDFWVYNTPLSAWNDWITRGNQNYMGWNIAIKSDGRIQILIGNTSNWLLNLGADNVITHNSWQHVAIVREGTGTNEIKLYVNGEQVAVGTYSGSYGDTDRPILIGDWEYYSGEIAQGYIDEIRISKGIARWVENFTPPEGSDVPVDNVVLLMHMDDENLSDSSHHNHVANKLGGISISDTKSKFGGHSLYFDGTNDYVTIPYHEGFALSSEEFTIDFWFYFLETGYLAISLGNKWCPESEGLNGLDWAFNIRAGYPDENFGICYSKPVGYESKRITANIEINSWHHAAIVRHGDILLYFIDGNQIGSISLEANFEFPDNNHALYIGQQIVGTNCVSTVYFNYYIDELRISKGTAYWTENFTPSAGPYIISPQEAPAMSQISDATIFDNSVSNAISFTVTDTNEQSLTITYQSSDESIIASDGITFSGEEVSYTGNTYIVNATSVETTVTLTVTPETTQSGTVFITITVTDPDGMTSATSFSLTVVFGNHYLSLLMHMDDADLSDSSLYNHETNQYGGVSYSDIQSKFGGKSAYLDGVVNYISIPYHESLTFGSEDFTIDLWFYFINTNKYISFGLGDQYCSTTYGLDWGLTIKSGTYSDSFGIIFSNPSFTSKRIAATIPVASWHHAAFVRSGNTLMYFLDGVKLGTSALETNFEFPDNNYPLYIGKFFGGSTCETTIYSQGYIDELKISKGIAYWTENFTPPAAQYIPQGEVLNPPEITQISDQSIILNSSTSPISFTVTDAESNLLTIVCSSSASEIIGSNDINIANSGSHIYSYSATAESPSCLTLVISSSSNLTGTVSITLTVTDSQQLTAETSFQLNVTEQGFSVEQNTLQLLLHMDDDDLSDSSPYNHVINQYGGNINNDIQRKFGVGSLYLDGVDNYISIPYHEGFAFGQEDFSIDFWFYFENIDEYINVSLGNYYCQTTYGLDWGISMRSGTYSYNLGFIYSNPSYTEKIISTTIPVGSWHHVAFVRSGDSLIFFMDGVKLDTIALETNFEFPDNNYPIYIGKFIGNTSCSTTYFFESYIDELRISKGIAYWTEDFTTSPGPYIIIPQEAPAMSQISDATIFDNSVSNAISFTVTDTNEQSLTITYQSSDESIIASDGITFSGEEVSYTGNTYIVNATSVETTVTLTVTPETTQSGTVFITITVTDPDGMTNSSSFKIIITPYDEHTVLMLHMDDEALSDSSIENHTVQLMNTITRTNIESVFGGYGAYFDKVNSSYLQVEDAEDWDFDTGLFTIDFWANWLQIEGDGTWSSTQLFYAENESGSKTWHVELDNYNNNGYRIFFNSPQGVGPVTLSQYITLSIGQWYHFAIVGESSKIVFYIDGQEYYSMQRIGAIEDTHSLKIGGGETEYYFKGYMDEIRISKGIARWTETFSPPTVPYGPIEAPEISLISDYTISANSISSMISFTATDADSASCSMSLSMTSSNPSLIPIENILSTCENDQYTIAVTPVENRIGTTLISMTITDVDGLTACTSFNITVTNNPYSFDVLLMHMDDTFLSDSSPISHTIIFHGDVTRSIGQGIFGDAAYFDGNGDYLEINVDEHLMFSTDDFTIDFWIKSEKYDDSYEYYLTFGTSSNLESLALFRRQNSSGGILGLLSRIDGNDSDIFTSVVMNDLNNWHHIALTRKDKTFYLFFDGVLQETPLVSDNNILPDSFYIGRSIDNSYPWYFNGYIDELRIIKGLAIWTESSFDLPNAPYSNNKNAPTISIISDQTIIENSTSSDITFTVTDFNEQALTITYASSDESIVSTNSITFSGDQVYSNGNTYTVTATSAKTCVTLTVTPETNQSGIVVLTITVTDPDGLTATKFFSITITEENDPPSIGTIQDQSTNENISVHSIPLTVTDAESSPCSMTLIMASSNTLLIPDEYLLYDCNSDQYSIVASPAFNQTGTSTISLTIIDSEGLSSSTSFNLTVIESDETQYYWTNFQEADVVLGQPNFTTNAPGTTNNTFTSPVAVAVDPLSGKVFVMEYDNSRILRFSSMNAAISGSQAEAVFGQADFIIVQANRGGSTAANTLNNPRCVFVDSFGCLWVTDTSNHRILRFDNASSKISGSDADGVLGQPDFTSSSYGTTQSTFNEPHGVWVDHAGRLWGVDYYNNRILRFDNAARKANGANADAVLGQSNFVSSSPGTTQSSLSDPYAVFGDNAGNLFVSEHDNHRVLIYNNASIKANGGNADFVFGQSDFTSNGYDVTSNSIKWPRGVAVDNAGRLYISDCGNHRILIVNDIINKTNGASADNVLGQPDFVTNTENTGGLSEKSLFYPMFLYFDQTSNHLWTTDWSNNRVLRYSLKKKTSPVISSISDATIEENTISNTISFTVTDINEQSLTITYETSDESLISTSSIEFTGGNVSSNGTSYTVTATSEGTVVTLMITPETDQSGFSFITITVTDPDGMSMSDSFSLTILGENLYNEHTVLMLHMDDNFLSDSSPQSHSVVMNGDVARAFGQGKFIDAAYFDRDSDYLEINVDENFQFGTGDFTIDFWIKTEIFDNESEHYLSLGSSTNPSSLDIYRIRSEAPSVGGKLTILSVVDGNNTTIFTPVLMNDHEAWHHIALTRKNKIFYVFFDGSKITNMASDNSIIPDTFTIGSASTSHFQGYIDEL
ncbi:secreted protein, partial [Candidatus Magnetomorum sp. HK-1]